MAIDRSPGWLARQSIEFKKKQEVSESIPYMNGIGITKKSEELSDVVWDKLDEAFIGLLFGMPIGLLSLFAAIASVLHNNNFLAFIFGLVSILGFLFFIKKLMPWSKAINELENHTDRVEQETELRGKGWVRS